MCEYATRRALKEITKPSASFDNKWVPKAFRGFTNAQFGQLMWAMFAESEGDAGAPGAA